jgi:hypothetical protein
MILFLFFIITGNVSAKCISDLYTAGLSADSFNYITTDEKENENSIGSTLGLGLKLGKIFYCPKKKLEIYSYYKLRYFNLAEARKRSEFSLLKENVYLNSTGADIRYLLNRKQELLLDLEAREDYAPAFLDSARQKIRDDIFLNFKALLGYRHFLKSNRSEDYTASFKLGPLVPIRSGVEVGYLSELNLEYFRRISKKYSTRADVYYSFYEQKAGQINLSRQELGLRYNYLFRF